MRLSNLQKRWLRLRRGLLKNLPDQSRGVFAYLGIVMLLAGSFVWYTNNRIQEKASASSVATEIQFLENALQAAETQTNPVIPIILNGTAAEAVSIDYTIIGGTATNAEDYTLAPTGTYTIPQGERGIGLPLTLIDDKQEEGGETVQIELSNPTAGVSLGANTILQFTITDSKNLQSDPYFGLKQEIDTLPVIDNPIPTSLPDFAEADPTSLPDFSNNDPDFLTVTNGLQLHLDADTLTEGGGAALGSWNDISGNSYDVAQADVDKQPIVQANSLNGKKTVLFDGVDDGLYGLDPILSSEVEHTLISVSKGATKGSAAVLSATGANLQYSAHSKNTQVGSRFAQGVATAGNSLYDGFPEPNVDSIDISFHGPTLDNLAYYSNGQKAVSRSGTSTAAYSPVDRFASVGNSQAGTSPFDSEVAEVLVYNRRLSDLERQEIECYLANKYAIKVTGCGNPLALHLDADTLTEADGSPLSAWSDQSDNNNNALQTTPANQPTVVHNALNGKKVVRFDGADDYLQSMQDIDLTDGYSAFFISNNHVRKDWNGLFRVASDLSITSDLEVYWQVGTTDNASGNFVVGSHESPSTFEGYAINDAPPGVGDYYLAQVQGGQSESSTINGIGHTASQSYGSGGATLENANNYWVGVGYFEAFLDGDIAEVIVYNQELSEAESMEVECYLSQKYDIDTEGCGTPLKLHLDADALTEADGSNISTWTDQTSSGLDAIQNDVDKQPTIVHNAINGKKTLRFDGADDYLELPEFYSDANSTLITVAKRTGANSDQTIFSDYGDGNNERMSLAFNTSNVFRSSYGDDDNNTKIFNSQGVNDTFFIGGVTSENQSITGYLNNGFFEGSNVSYDVYVNYNGTLGTPTLGAAVQNNNSKNFYLNGDIAEFIYYDRPLTEEEYAEVRCYLGDKYAIDVEDCGNPLSLHLDADTLTESDGVALTAWPDNSANNHDISQSDSASQPTVVHNAINGKKVVRFDGVDDFLEGGDILDLGTKGKTVIAVSQNSNTTSYPGVVGKSSARDFTGRWAIFQSTPTNTLDFLADIGSNQDELGSVAPPGMSIKTGVIERGQRTKAYQNGSFEEQSSATASFDNFDTTDNLYVGVYGDNTGLAPLADSFLNGDIAEILVYDTALNQTEREQVECYLSQKYALDTSSCFQDSIDYYLDATAIDELDTTQVVDGKINTWVNQEGDASKDFTQGTASARPTYNADLRAPSVDFDGNDTLANVPNTVMNTGGNYTSIANLKFDTIAGTDYIHSFGTGTGGRYRISATTSGITYGGVNSSFSSHSLGNISNQYLNISHLLENNSFSGSEFYINDTLYPSANSSNIGGQKVPSTIGDGLDGQFFNSILFNKKLSDSELDIVSTSLAASAANPSISGYKYSTTHSRVVGANSEIQNPNNTNTVLDVELVNSQNDAKVFLGYDPAEPVSLSGSDLGSGIVSRWNNDFAFDKTGSTDATLIFDFDEYLGGNPAGSGYELLYRPYSAGDYNPVLLQSSAINGSIVEFTVANSDLEDGYYTLGSTNTSSSPLSPASLPSAITDLTTVLNANYGEVDLSFTAPAANGSVITDYVIEYSADNFSTILVYNDGVSTASSYTLTDLLNGPEYQFRIRAITSAGEQASPSNVDNVVFAPRINSVTPNTGEPEGGQTVVINADNTTAERGQSVELNNTGNPEFEDKVVTFLYDTTALVSSGLADADCKNFQFTFSGTAQDFWVDNETCGTAQTLMYAKVSLVADETKTFKLALLEPGINGLNPDGVFEFLETFEGTAIDQTKWDQAFEGVYMNVSNGKLNITSGAGNWHAPQIFSKQTFVRGEKELITKFDCGNSGNIMYGWMNTTTPVGTGSFGEHPYKFYYASANNYVYENASQVKGAANHGTCANKYHRIKLKEGAGAQYELSTDGANWTPFYDSTNLSNSEFRIGFNGHGGQYSFDNFIVKDSLQNEPVVSFGPQDPTFIALDVQFDGINATIEDILETGEIEVIVSPANVANNGLGSVDVTLTNVDTQSDTLVNGYTFAGPTISSISPSTGPISGGQTITIRGDSFPANLTAGDIEFASGDSPSALTFISDEEIQVVTPQSSLGGDGSGSVNVTLTTQYGNQAISAYSYVNPQISSVSPADGPVEGGNTVLINGDGFSGNGQIQAVDISNPTGDTLIEEEIDLVVDTKDLIDSGVLDFDCTNIRAQLDGVDIPFWIDGGCNTINTVIWVQIPVLGIDGVSIELIYDSSTVESRSNITPFSFGILGDSANVGWFKANNGISLDANDKVTEWSNSANESHSILATELSGADINYNKRDGKPSINLLNSGFSGPVLQTGTEFTTYSVSKLNTIPNANLFYNGDGGANGAGHRIRNNRYNWIYGGFSFHDFGPAATLDWTQLGTFRAGTSSTFYYNGAFQGSASTSYGNPQTQGLFMSQADFEMAELILFDQPLGSSDRDAVDDYLSKKYDLRDVQDMPTYEFGEVRTLTTVSFGSYDIFLFEKDITINNPTGASITDAEVLVELDTRSLSQMKSDCSDLRFQDTNGSNLEYFIESGCNTAETLVWIKYPTLVDGDNVVTMTYGNPTLSAESNIDNFSFGNPLTSSNVTLWMQANSDGFNSIANGATVPDWFDRSNYGRHGLVAGDPVIVRDAINSRPAVVFDGAGDYFELDPEVLHSEFTHFAVLKNNEPSSSTLERGYVYTNQVDGTGGSFTFQKRQGYQLAGNQNINFQYWDSITPHQTLILNEDNSVPILFELRADSGGAEGFVNAVTKDSTTEAPTTNLTPNEAFIGARLDSQGTDYLDAEISELIVLKENDSVNNDAIRGYLNHKYRLYDIANLPSVTNISSESQSTDSVSIANFSPLSVVSADAQFIEAVVPQSKLEGVNGVGDGFTDITVHVSEYITTTSTDSYEYKLPEIYTITPTEGPDQGGNNVVIKGDYFSPLYYVQEVEINNDTGDVVTDHETVIAIDTKSAIELEALDVDCSNISVLDSTGTPIDYYLDGSCGAEFTPLWLRIPSLNSGVNTFTVQYASTSTTSKSDRSVFSFGALLGDTELYTHFAASDVLVDLDSTVTTWEGRKGIDATSSSTPTLVKSPHQALPSIYFDGGDLFATNYNGIVNTNYTMVTSSFRDSVKGEQWIIGTQGFSNGRDTRLGYNADTSAYFQRYNFTAATIAVPGFTVRENSRHVGVLESGVNKRIYYNGVLGGVLPGSSAHLATGNSGFIGTHANSGKFEGGINEILIFTKALTDPEIAILDEYLEVKYSALEDNTVDAIQAAPITVDGIYLDDMEFVDSQTYIGRAPANTGTDKDVQYTSILGNAAQLIAAYDYGVDLPPNSINDLVLTEPASGVIELSWTEPGNNGQPISDYIIEYATQSDFSNVQTYNDGVSVDTSLVIADLDQFTTYYFRVRAVNSVGSSIESNSQERTALGCDVDHGGQDWIISANETIAGIHCNIDEFLLETGVTAALEDKSLIKIIANSAIINGDIDGVGAGYAGGFGPTDGEGPGGGKYTASGNGAGHGGYGGISLNPIDVNAPQYGSVKYPSEFGSGGSGSSRTSSIGGFGGGAITLDIVGDLEVNGAINMNASAAVEQRPGGGAGGSVLIYTNDFTGTGAISANGSAGKNVGSGGGTYHGGGGAGGRVAAHVNTNNFGGLLSAAAGTSTAQIGGAGTIYLHVESTSREDLAIDNGDNINSTSTNVAITEIDKQFNPGVLEYTEVTVNNKAKVVFTNSVSIDESLFVPAESEITFDEEIFSSSPLDVVLEGVVEFGGVDQRTFNDIAIGSTGVLTHSKNSTTEEHKLDLVLDNLIIEAGGEINVSEKGYISGQDTNDPVLGQGYGPGAGTILGGGYAGGGGYGNKGGDGGSSFVSGLGGPAYGSKSEPDELGSGGARDGDGAGSVKLEVVNSFLLNGAIIANGENGASGVRYLPGGSGGSIWLDVQELNGSGLIQSRGGDGSGDQAGRGAGGRIALYYQDKDNNIISESSGGINGFDAVNIDGTIYEHQIPEAGLASATFASDPFPVQANVTYDLQIENILNVHGNPIRDGYYDDVLCDITVTGDSGNYNETITGGNVVDGVCVMPSSFTAPTATGVYDATITVTGTDVAATAESVTLQFTVAPQGSNLAKAQITPNETKPQYATLSPAAVQIIGQTTTITSTGYVDSGNDQELNGLPCLFRITGPSSFDQTFTSANMVGGECSYNFTEFELPTVAGTYNVTVEIAGDTGTLITDPVPFDRAFDIDLTGSIIYGGANTTDKDPLVGDEVNTLTSPIVYKYDGVTPIDEGTACLIQVTDNAGFELYSSTINSTGQCQFEVPASTLTGASVDVVSQVNLVVDGVTHSFLSGQDTFPLVGSPSDVAKEDSANAGKAEFSTQSNSPDPAFLNENVTLTVNGLLDSITDGALENATCEFVVTNPNTTTFTFNSTVAANGECQVVIPQAGLLEGGSEVEGEYSFVLNILGDSGTLTTPSTTFDRLYNIDLTGGFIPGATTSNPDPIVLGQAPTLTSPYLQQHNGTTNLANGLPCENELTVSGQTPEIVTGTTNGGYCTTPMSAQGNLGTATMISRVTVAGQEFETGATPTEVKALNNASICGLVFRDDTSDQSYDGSELLFAGSSLRLKDNSGATIDTKTSVDTGYQCFGALFDGTYTLEILTGGPGGTQTLPTGGNNFFTINLAAGGTENRAFGFNGNENICPHPIFNDVDEDGVFGGSDVSLIDGSNTLAVTLYLATDLATPIETIQADGSLCFQPQIPDDYVIEMDIPTGMSPTGTGFTEVGNKVQRPVTLEFATEASAGNGFSFDPSGEAEEDPNNPGQPTNSGTVVFNNQLIYVGYNFDATTTGLVDTGNGLPLDGVACSMTFSGPGFSTPLTKNGNVIDGECYVDPIPDAEGPHEVTTTVQGATGPLTTIATTFDVLPNEIDICPLPFRDYNQDGTRNTNEPYIAGLNVDLIDNNTTNTIASLTTDDQGLNCFQDVSGAEAEDYQVNITAPSNSVETTSTSLSVNIDPLPNQDENVSFGFKGIVDVCLNSVYMDNNANSVLDGLEATLPGFGWRVRDEFGNLVSVTTSDAGGQTCATELLEAVYTVQTDNPVSDIELTGVQALIRTVTATPGSGNGATTNIYDESYGYENTAEICPNPTFADYNQDGVWQDGEDEIGNLNTRLYRGTDNSGTLLETILTNSSNCFAAVDTGDTGGDYDFFVEQDVPNGGVLTSTAVNYTFNQAFGVQVETPFGYKGNTTICPTPTFQDLDRNGAFDSEPTLTGVATTLKDTSNTTIGSLTTNSAGTNCFTELLEGSYIISQERPENTVSTTGGTVINVTTTAGNTENTPFGYDGRPLICPVVYRDDDGNGVFDGNEFRFGLVTVTLKDDLGSLLETITSTQGENCFDTQYTEVGESYIIESSAYPDYTITTSIANGSPNDNPDTTSNLVFGQKYEPEFGYNGNGQICAANVFEDFNSNGQYDAGLDTYLPDGTIVELTTLQGSTNYPAIAITGGTNCFTNVAPGQYTLDVADTDKPLGSLSTTGGVQQITLSPGQTQNFDFGYTGDVTICPQVTFEDLDFNAVYDPTTETQLSGIVVNLYRGSDLVNPYTSVTLSGNGLECFTGLFADDYRVELQGVNTYFPGQYWNTNEVMQSGTDPNDFYQDITAVSQDYILQDFGFTQNPDFTLGAIFGFLYVDRDENNNYDIAGADNFELTVFDNDVPVVDQTVKLFKLNTSTTLYEEVDTTVSDAEGNYSFDRLGVGDYEVRVPNNSLVGIKSITPNPSVIPVVITNDAGTGLNNKAYEQDMSFQFTARICPFLYIDINEDGNYDMGVDYDITANEGASYSLSYNSFNGQQSAGTYSINGSSPCVEELPPRDYTVSLSDAFGTANNGAFGSSGEYPITFFDQTDETNWTRTIYLGTEVTDIETRVFSNQVIDQTESEIEGTIWHNRPIYGSSAPYTGGLDEDGGDDKTEVTDDPANTSGYDYDYDNDFAYDGVTLELIKCYNGFQDPVPLAVWNANPPTTVTNANGDYKFDNTNVQFSDGSGGFYGIVPGEYAVVRQGTVTDESSLTGVRAKECDHIAPAYEVNSIFFDNYPSNAPNYPVLRTPLTPGSVIVQDEALLYTGEVEAYPYIDQNQDLTLSGNENSCYLQSCGSVPTPTSNVYGSFELRDAVTGDILGVVPYNVKSNSVPAIGYSGVAFGGIPGVIPGDYEVEMIDIEPIDANTSSPHYTEIQAGELVKNHAQTVGQSTTYKYGFNPLFGTEISGQVYVNRGVGGGADVDGADDQLVTDFDNDEILVGYTVEIRNGSGELVATEITDANGEFSWIPGGHGIPEGSYSTVVINAPPTGTECANCSSGGYITVLGGTSELLNRDMTYGYIGYIGADAFVDNNGDGVIEESPNETARGREIAINNIESEGVATWDYTVVLTYEKGQPNETIINTDYITPTCGIPAINRCVDINNLGDSYFINSTLKPGTYTIDLTINDPTLILASNSTGVLTNTFTLAPQGKNWVRWAFEPRTDNSIQGNVFIDRGTLNETFEVNGDDGILGNPGDPETFDNEQALVGATVKINGPNGQIISADAPTDVNGNYTFTGIETGFYKLFQDDPNTPGSYIPFVETTDSIINTIQPQCMTLFGCFDDMNSSFSFNLSRKQVLTTGTDVTNNYTYVFTNELAAYSVLDLNGDGVISSYSNGDFDEVVGNQDYELVNNNTGIVLDCSGLNYGSLGTLNSLSYTGSDVCNWKALPAEIDGSPASYTIRKLANLPGQDHITTRRRGGVHGPGGDGLSLGVVDEAVYAFNQFGLNQQQAFAFYQTQDVVTNNASITGFAFIDVNGDGIYQPDGLDGDPNTLEDNETPLLTTDFILSGDADRAISAGSAGQYQFTDLAAGNYTVVSNLGAGTGSYTMRITNATLVNDTTNGDFYRVTFSTQGFNPEIAGRHIRFYWDTETAASTGLEHFDTTQYEIPIASRPAGATQICAVVMEDATTPIEHSGDCQVLP